MGDQPPTYREAVAMGPVTVSLAFFFIRVIFTFFFSIKYDDIMEASARAPAGHAAVVAAAAATESNNVSVAWSV